jgi:hypothetical protein
MTPVPYFWAVGVVLAAIWLAQHGPLAQQAAREAAQNTAHAPEQGSGGGDTIPTPKPVFGSYAYNYNENPSPDQASPYGGVTDNTSTGPDVAAAGSYTSSGGAVPARLTGSGGGGVVTPPPAIQPGMLQNITGGYTGGYVPYAPAPTSTGAGGSTRVL